MNSLGRVACRAVVVASLDMWPGWLEETGTTPLLACMRGTRDIELSALGRCAVF